MENQEYSDYFERQKFEEKTSPFDDHLLELSDQQLHDIYVFCKAVEQLPMLQLQSIILRHSQKFMVQVQKKKEINDTQKQRLAEDENPLEDGDDQVRNSKLNIEIQRDSKLKAKEEVKIATKLPRDQRIPIEKHILLLIINDILQYQYEEQFYSDLNLPMNFIQLLPYMEELMMSFREFINFMGVKIIKKDLTLIQQAFLDSLQKFTMVIFNNQRVLEGLNRILSSKLQEQTEQQLKEIQDELNVEKEYHQFYKTLVEFRDQQLSLDSHRQPVQVVQNFKQIMKEYKAIKVTDEDQLRSSLDELRQKLEAINSQINPVEFKPETQQLESKTSQYEEFIKKQEEEKQQQQTEKVKVRDLEKVREKGLQEIFKFYAIQSVQLSKCPTFDSQQQDQNRLNMQYFLKFCSDFQLPYDKNLWTDIFKKKVFRSDLILDYPKFKECITEIFRINHENQTNEAIKKVNELRQKVNKFKEQQYQQFVDSYKSNDTNNDGYPMSDSTLDQNVDLLLEQESKSLEDQEQFLEKLNKSSNYLELAHVHMSTDNQKVYKNTMKGYFKPFWIREKKPNEQSFLDQSYTGHTNNNINNDQSPKIQVNSQNSAIISRNNKHKYSNSLADDNMYLKNDDGQTLNANTIKKETAGTKSQQLKNKVIEETKMREQLKEATIKKIREKKFGILATKGDSIFNLEKLRNLKDPHSLFKGDKTIESIEAMIGIDLSPSNKDGSQGGYDFTFKSQESTQFPIQQTNAQIQTYLGQRPNKQEQPKANLPVQTIQNKGNLLKSLSKSQSRQQVGISPTRNNPYIQKTTVPKQEEYAGNSMNIASSIDLKSKDYYTKMINRAKEIDNLHQNKEKIRQQNINNIHMKRLSVNRQVIDGYQPNNLSKSIDISLISNNKLQDQQQLKNDGKSNKNIENKKALNKLNNINNSMIKL
ncbi:UNKNOWN [Stylonychia lemnae]|uniref:Uncharacterized protein n=1 Tax=Stylonychia lemnae TaxID=5949 RepID=A0A078ATH2_STYLE|nr:UNKNOWN [Stylonychia lemnae]|eukprot:CDW84163.1 UNKNOWN [Stylonychia lemnae]